MNKKGFTLMELLAVIIVLAIIALISIPIVMNIIEEVEKKSSENSANGYITALNEEIVNSNFSTEKKINNGYYYSAYLKSEYDFEVGGYTPIEDSWVHITNGEVSEYSLKFKKYVVSYVDDKITINETIVQHKICFKINVKYKDIYSYGDSYSCYVGDGLVRKFYLLEDGDSEDSTGTTPSDKVSLLMNKNLGDTIGYNKISEYVDKFAKKWSRVTITIPTFDQISKAGENYSETSSSNRTILLKKKFLYDNTNCTDICYEKIDDMDNSTDSNQKGFWTNTVVPWDKDWVWVVGMRDEKSNMWHAKYDITKEYGFRPVIVIEKKNL